MSLAKKGSGIQFVLPAEATAPAPIEDTKPVDKVEPVREPRSGVARIAMAVSLGRDVKEQFEAQKARLADYEKGSVAILLDPRRIKVSQFANRHEASFSLAEFADFKEDLRESGGNIVPVKVRPVDGPQGEQDYELVYGHRRHRACLELGLPVKAVVEAVDDKKLFIEMDRENRGRAALSPWEQGVMYLKALTTGLFPNQRRLASEMGLSQASVSKSIAIGGIPHEVISCFTSPLFLTYRAGQQLVEVLAADEATVLRRAAQLHRDGAGQTDAGRLAILLGADGPATQPKARAIVLSMGKKKVGKAIVQKDGSMTLSLELPALPLADRERFLDGLQSMLGDAAAKL